MELHQLFVPSVYTLILFLGYPSQWLLLRLEPAPLTTNELIFSNIIIILILITYTRSVYIDPGRIPKDWTEGEGDVKARKWCRKCDAAKPMRAHHCRSCGRCIPKMDHHCPWTSNCVSHRTFPTFLRFLHFTTTGLSLLQYLLLLRLHHLWVNRHLPSSLGPPTPLLFHLFFTLGVNSITLFAVGILAVNNTWALLINTTTIESWEISRHATLVRRARRFGGYLRAPGGEEIKITHQEFPFDVGIWSNICQGMGSRNPLTWLNPFAAAPETATGLKFDENGFEDPGTTWPPPDPDRGYKRPARAANEDAFVYADEGLGGADSVKAFKARQDVDAVRKRKPFVQRLEEEYAFGNDASDAEEEKEPYGDGEGEEGWRNSEGECLKDFGLDEDVEFYDEGEDEIPLGELLARRRAAEQVYEE